MHRSGRKNVITTFLVVTLMIEFTFAEYQTSTTSHNDVSDLTEADMDKRPDDGFVHNRNDFKQYQDLGDGDGGATARQLRELYENFELPASDVMKRASMRGFQGMRGKKNNNYEAPYPLLSEYYDKRALTGFHGMRGKKTGAYLDYELDKRAPMGFHGMRGKKSYEQLIMEELEKRAMMGFQGMRGKKAEDLDESDELSQQPSLSPSEWPKRTSMAFQDMQERKNLLDDLNKELEKRALTSSFHGMRGKKNMLYDNENFPANMENNYMEKRPMMGFHGMRGKRSTNYYGNFESSSRYEKRSPFRFLDSRGKKNPRWEMRGKFVGVRGKKWLTAPKPLLLPFNPYDEREPASSHDTSQFGRH